MVLGLLPGSHAFAEERAIWIWEPETYAMLQDGAEAGAAMEFLRADLFYCEDARAGSPEGQATAAGASMRLPRCRNAAITMLAQSAYIDMA